MAESNQSPLMPVLFLPHGGGPMPILGEANHAELVAFLESVGVSLPRPRALLMISAHWEEEEASVSSAAAPAMLYDYYGFPPETYQFQYPAPGSPVLAEQVLDLLQGQGISARLDKARGYDHGTFVPLMLMYPAADIPVVQLSLVSSLNPAAQIALGKAIAPLREQGVLILGSGMSFHNMQAFFSGNPAVKLRSQQFDDWLNETLTASSLQNSQREARLEQWHMAPEARFSHPREEHLLPLLVCFGAAARSAAAPAERNFSGLLFNTHISGFVWR